MNMGLCDHYGFDPAKRQVLLDCLGFTEQDKQLLEQLQARVIGPNVDELVANFYAHLTNHPWFGPHLPEKAAIERLRHTMRGYLLSLGVDFDSESYFENRLRIGVVHRRIALPLTVYQAAYSVLQQDILRHTPSDVAAELRLVLIRVASLDMALAIETYYRTEVEALSSTIHDLEATGTFLRQAAETDPLTGVANRRRILEVLAETLADQRGPRPAVLMADLDRFKQVNDRYGHPIGDELLILVVDRIQASLRAGTDHLGRIGGEEFLVVLSGKSTESTMDIAERVRASVAESPVRVSSGELLACTISIGVARARADESIEQLIERADRALYQAKTGGRNRVIEADQG